MIINDPTCLGSDSSALVIAICIFNKNSTSPNDG